jgi:hypothetical protein
MIQRPSLAAASANEIDNKNRGPLPSRQQLDRLQPGDEVRLKNVGWISCLVTYRHANECIGRLISYSDMNANSTLEQDDHILFSLEHVWEVKPRRKPPIAVPDWLLIDHTPGPLLLRTKAPQVLALVCNSGTTKVFLQPVQWFTQPENEAEANKILEGGKFFYLRSKEIPR